MAIFGATVIWDSHEDYVRDLSDLSNSSRAWLPQWLRPLAISATKQLLVLADRKVAAVVVATHEIGKSYRNENLTVVGNEVRVTDFLNVHPSFHSRQILFTGRVNASALFDEAVDAVAMSEHLSLAVAGPSSSGPNWERARRILGDRLLHLGWLSPVELSTAMSNSCVGLITYPPWPSNEIGIPTKLFEFAAAGLPVVCTPNSPLLAAIDDSGAGVTTSGFTAVDLHASLMELTTDDGRWGRMSVAGKAWAQTHGDWQGSERRLLALYKKLEHGLRRS